VIFAPVGGGYATIASKGKAVQGGSDTNDGPSGIKSG
jgi:hypothetical protein